MKSSVGDGFLVIAPGHRENLLLYPLPLNGEKLGLWTYPNGILNFNGAQDTSDSDKLSLLLSSSLI